MIKMSVYLFLAVGLMALLAGRVSAATVSASFAEALAGADNAASNGWRLATAEEAGANDEALPALGEEEPMRAEGDRWVSADGAAQVRVENGRVVAIPGAGAGRHVVASYTVPAGAAGFYAIRDSVLRPAEGAGRVELRVFVRRPGASDRLQPEPAVYTFVDAGDVFDFDTFLGYLNAGDSVHVSVGAEGGESVATGIDFEVARTPEIPVSIFSGDAGDPDAMAAPGGWSVAMGVADTPAARRLAWSDGGRGAAEPSGAERQLEIRGGETVAMFRVPQSGYYAMHDAQATVTQGGAEARIYVGSEATPRRVLSIGERTSLNTDLGYISKGEVIQIAFAAADDAAAVAFDATVVEWAPRRAPLRVRRGEDGYLDVYAPEAPHIAIDIPRGRWLTVPAMKGDATEAIRAAIEKAKTADEDQWVGIRLEAGATYVVGSEMDGGTLFELGDIGRVVFDGNSATVRITSPELQRRGFNLFVTGRGAHHLVFADLIVEATTVPFTVGRIIGVEPERGNTQTVTVRMEPGSVDPLKEISRNGRGSAYVYDPHIPGRLGFGTWSHYPGHGDGPQIRPTDRPGVFTHALTRTGSSLNVGDKWLVKNKGAGVIYLTARGDAHDITLSGIEGRASGGGALRLWSASAVNILNCRFEPNDRYWISSSADGIHGRAREGVWIEDTIIRGVCEDIMNTYGRTMAIKPDDDAADSVVSLGVFDSSVRSGRNPLKDVAEDDVRAGDRLVFFVPRTGKVLGYAQVLERDGERVRLSEPVQGLVPLTDPRSREATMVYSIDSVANFVVRDSKFMDSMRIGIYIKARGGVVWGNTIEGQSAPAIFAANEPEWPEGPPATHLWVQGNTFSQNNYGYMSRYRDFLVVDPADISVYTRRFRDPSEPDSHRAFLTSGQHANSHVKIIGNTFHDWRGMGVAVRNSRNVIIRDNLFLPPAEDAVLRDTLAQDSATQRGGVGRYAGVLLGSVDGVRLSGNRFVGLPRGDQTVAHDGEVHGVVAADNAEEPFDRRGLAVALPFSEWFGEASANAAPDASGKDAVQLRGAAHAAGRLGAGLLFDGRKSRATLTASAVHAGRPLQQFTLALWVRPDAAEPDATQVVYGHGDAQRGVVVAVDRGRLVGGVWQADEDAWLDLGPAAPGVWQHIALVFDGPAGTLRGYVDGAEIATAMQGPAGVPSTLGAVAADASFGGAAGPIRLGADRVVTADRSAYRGGIDEFHLFRRAVTPADVAALALRRSVATPTATAAR